MGVSARQALLEKEALKPATAGPLQPPVTETPSWIKADMRGYVAAGALDTHWPADIAVQTLTS